MYEAGETRSSQEKPEGVAQDATQSDPHEGAATDPEDEDGDRESEREHRTGELHRPGPICSTIRSVRAFAAR
jgi:hypothetical protein